ncbi:hypothetical protein HDU81_003548 [Chytriomyces hyalinus]|nr:hypothetical protein HDU81_003548 [Chytriomyces hyalinus]
MAFTGSLLSAIQRVSAPPQMLMADAPHRFIAAQAAALDAIASVLAMGSRESAAVAESVRAAASLAADMAQTEVIVMAPASVSVGWVAQSVFTRASNQPMQLPLYNSPSLALDAWKTLISTLKAAVSNAGKALPAAANVALIAAAAAIALHVATVRLPDLRKYLEKQGVIRGASSASASKPPQSGSTGVDELANEVVALRAEVQRYHATPLPSMSPEQSVAGPTANATYAELSESHIRSLEHSNALLRDSVAAMTKEIDRRSRNEAALTTHLESLLARAQHETSTVTRLEHQVRDLSAEKEEQRMRIESLEGHLEELRGLFGSMAVGGGKHGAEGLSRSGSWVSSSSVRGSVSRGRRSLREDDGVQIVTPVLKLENSSLSEDSVSLHGASAEPEHAPTQSGSVSSDKGDAEWETVFDHTQEMKGENVLE